MTGLVGFNLIVNSIVPGLGLSLGVLYSLYFAWNNQLWSVYLVSVIFGLGTLHQIAEIRTWTDTGRVPAPNWLLGDYVETSVYLLAVISFVLFAYSYDRIEDLLEQKDLLLDELQHRVKNNLQTIQSLLSLEKRKTDSKQLQELLHKLSDKIQSFALLHEKLNSTEAIREVHVNDYLTDLCDALNDYKSGQKQILLRTKFEDVNVDVDKMVACGLIVSELVENAYEHAFPDSDGGEVSVRFQENEHYRLTVEDNGRGIGNDEGREASRGLNIVESLVEFELDGDLEIESDKGTVVSVTFD